MRMIVQLTVLALVVIGVGCGPNVAQLDARERADARLRRAKALEREGDAASSARLLALALREDPDLALAHFELAMLAQDKLNDPVTALYHYQRYLELRPKSEKRAVIEWRGQKLRRRLAEQALGREGAATLAELRTQIEQLRQENARLQADNERRRAGAPAARQRQ